MKIAFIVPSLINKGPIIVVDTIIKNLISKVEQIDVYYFDDKKGIDFICPTHKITMDMPIDFDQYDLIHSHMYRPDKYVNKWKSKIKKAKTITTIHQDIFQNVRYSHNIFIALIFEYVWKKIIRKMDMTVVISKKLYNLYEKQIKKLVVIYNGVDISINDKDSDPEIRKTIKGLSEKGHKIIGTYALITKRKGIDQLVSLLKLRNDIGLVLIGEGVEKERLMAKVEKNGWKNRVLSFPYLEKPYNYIDEFDVYAMPSRSEGFGLAIAEAALTKTPIICSNIEVFKEIFDRTEVSFFELENIRSLSDSVDSAIGQEQTKTEKAYNKIVTQFSGQTMADNYLKLYKRILNES